MYLTDISFIQNIIRALEKIKFFRKTLKTTIFSDVNELTYNLDINTKSTIILFDVNDLASNFDINTKNYNYCASPLV